MDIIQKYLNEKLDETKVNPSFLKDIFSKLTADCTPRFWYSLLACLCVPGSGRMDGLFRGAPVQGTWCWLIEFLFFMPASSLSALPQLLRPPYSYLRLTPPQDFFFKQLTYLAVLSFSCGRWDLIPWPGIEPGPPALGAQSLSHWTTREVPSTGLLNLFICYWNFLLLQTHRLAIYPSSVFA